MANWTQPICDNCHLLALPGRTPHRIITPEDETCCYCGKATSSGLYIRVNPDHVKYPTTEDNDA